jgi:hypothetical protein
MSTRRRQAGRRGPDPASLLAAPTDAPAAPLPSALDIQPDPPSPPPFERPDSVIGLVSDMIRDQKQGYTFLIIAGGLLIILAACCGVVIWVMGASKGFNGIPIPAVIAGLPGASLLAFLTSRVVRWIKRRLRTSANGGRPDSSGG